MQKISYLEAKTGMKIAKAIWHPYSYTVLLNAGTILTDIYIKRLKELKVKDIYITEGNFLKEENFADIPTIKHFPNCIEKQVYLETYQRFKTMFEDTKEGKTFNLPPVAQTVESLVDQILHDQNILIQLALVKSHDNYTVTHSINVAIFSVLLGSFLGWAKEDLTNLGIGALLHDIGKAKIPLSILNKPGSLSFHEFGVIKHHPVFGYEELCKVPGMSDSICSIVRDHHERCDGTGYPNRLKDSEISLAAKIVAIADVYDALTTDRVYREAMMPHDAVELIMTNSADGHLDHNLVKTFLQNVAIYPIGAMVELTNGHTGKIVTIPPQMPMRPTIQLDYKIGGIDTICLLNQPTLFIKKIVNY